MFNTLKVELNIP